MDSAAAKSYRHRLKREMEAVRNRTPKRSYALVLIALEVGRMKQKIYGEGEAWGLFGDCSKDKIAVDDESLMLQLSNDYVLNLKDMSSLERFRGDLVSELPKIIDFPLTFQLTQRVIELVDEEISRMQQNTRGESSSSRGKSVARSGSYRVELNKSIDDAIKTVIQRNQEGASSDQVLDYLRENNSIEIDDYVRSAARQRFFEATFAISNNPAPGESIHCCSFLELINPCHWSFLHKILQWFRG